MSEKEMLEQVEEKSYELWFAKKNDEGDKRKEIKCMKELIDAEEAALFAGVEGEKIEDAAQSGRIRALNLKMAPEARKQGGR